MASGYYDDDGFYHYGEDDLADPGAGFSDLLNKATDAIPQGARSVVVREVAADPTIRDYARAAITNAVTDLSLVDRDTPGLPLEAPGDAVWTFLDARRRVVGKMTADAVFHAPAGIRTPNAGVTIVHTPAVIAGTFDKLRRRFMQDAIGPDGKLLSSTIADIAKQIETGGGLTKRAPHVLTGSAGADIKSTATAQTVVMPVTYAARVHANPVLTIANRNDRAALPYLGGASVTGVWWGRAGRSAFGELNGTYEGPAVKVADAFTIPADGSPIRVPLAIPLTAKGEAHVLSFGYTTPDGQTNHAGIGGGWVTASAADAGNAATPASALTRVQQLPFDVFLDCEVDATTKLLAWFGDSLTLGTGSTLPIFDSAARQHGLANDVWPVHFAHHGSTMAGWTNGDDYRFTKYGDLDIAAVIWALGSNDIFDGVTLDVARGRFVALWARVVTYLSPVVYLATIMPRNGSKTDAAREAVRLAYNAWLWQRPMGALGVFDFAKSVESTVGTVRADYIIADEVHLTTSGCGQNARAVPASLAA